MFDNLLILSQIYGICRKMVTNSAVFIIETVSEAVGVSEQLYYTITLKYFE
jgi:hypothetical protein